MLEITEFFISHTIDEEFPPGAKFEHWPLHMTVVPPFEISSVASTDMVLESMSKNGRKLSPIELGYGVIRSGAIPIEIGRKAMYGDDYDIPVVEILDPSNKLHELHSMLINDIGRVGCRFLNINFAWAGENYSPHATMKSGKELDRPFICTSLTLHKKEDEVKSIVDTVRLCD